MAAHERKDRSSFTPFMFNLSTLFLLGKILLTRSKQIFARTVSPGIHSQRKKNNVKN